MKRAFFITIVTFFACAISAQTTKNPSFEEVISLRSVSNPVISPDGQHIVFESQSVDWKENKYDRELWISKNGDTPFQLTNNAESRSNNPKWSPDGKWIAFLSKKGKNTQIQVIRSAGGESFQVTHTKKNISNFEWSPDGQKIAFLQSEDKSKEEEKREDKYGGFAVEDAEYSLRQIWVADFNPALLTQMPLPEQIKDTVYSEKLKAKLLIDSVAFSINSFKWSPDGQKIAFGHQPNPTINGFFKADISIYDIASKSHKVLVNNLSYDGLEGWSPDSKSILYESSLNDSTSNYYKNGKLFRIDLDGSNTKQLAKDFDENISRIVWNKNGIFGLAWQKTVRQMVRIDPKNGTTTILTNSPKRIWSYSFSKDGKRIAYSGVNDEDLSEIYQSEYPIKNPKRLTQSTQQIQNWLAAKSEVVSWKSKDGAIIEGVLHKPMDYDPNKKYPLLVIIHGGPTGISTPSATPAYVYPMIQWLNKGALILRPNYRGSAGYGEKFRSLNVKNLGVGDAWDIISGVDYLENKGIIDGNKVGAMGWSQGGYISAFLTTNSNKFKAISVGAGISNWMTYYVNTDIHPFTRQYLKATPWSDKKIYEKTSPMTNIRSAATPTLIQHGEFDRRVPTANAYELFQGLQDVGVPTELIIYKGFGHGINKPKERLAAMWHNWQWFGKYIWDEEIELPEK
ncbi:S9 family peptidase [Aquimarina spongiae]|uniref:Dipeptidyl aminopeptidase/acylaminoacyl peptidase n=1 Tax=Aquimarina spongiae TaxID=570521 RepID=A0A1M6DVS2_9FLAO|nr:S9 family peptidase [Aquimarina spongiae]SHI77354.1 Dipeptidyl aminopeptidase/acylaminoacyl peptidase [Aquimarina spongiae]